jgi:hypothetical protein
VLAAKQRERAAGMHIQAFFSERKSLEKPVQLAPRPVAGSTAPLRLASRESLSTF